tara:strand:+ start:514 stop:708 length:195 start_codon:yes stop_codon:yes gene_type:complete
MAKKAFARASVIKEDPPLLQKKDYILKFSSKKETRLFQKHISQKLLGSILNMLAKTCSKEEKEG